MPFNKLKNICQREPHSGKTLWQIMENRKWTRMIPIPNTKCMVYIYIFACIYHTQLTTCRLKKHTLSVWVWFHPDTSPEKFHQEKKQNNGQCKWRQGTGSLTCRSPKVDWDGPTICQSWLKRSQQSPRGTWIFCRFFVVVWIAGSMRRN